MKKYIINENWEQEEIEDLSDLFIVLLKHGSFDAGYTEAFDTDDVKMQEVFNSLVNQYEETGCDELTHIYLIKLPNTPQVVSMVEPTIYNGNSNDPTMLSLLSSFYNRADCEEINHWCGAGLTESKKKKKNYPFSSVTYTTGDIGLNIKHFNKCMGTDGLGDADQQHHQVVGDTLPDGPIAASSDAGTSSGEGASAGEGGGVAESLELDEDKIYVGKLGQELDLPSEIHLIDQATVEKIIDKLEPEETFLVGYVNPVYFYKELWDSLPIYKCTEMAGYTGVDFSTSEDEIYTDQADRIERAKAEIDLAKETGKTMQVGSDVNYSMQNKLVQRGNRIIPGKTEIQNTILFYPVSAAKVCYFVKLPNHPEFIQITAAQLEEYIYAELDKIKVRVPKDKARTKVYNTLYGQSVQDIDRDTRGDAALDPKYIYKYNRDKHSVRALYTSQIYYISTVAETRGAKMGGVMESLREGLRPFDPDCFEKVVLDSKVRDWYAGNNPYEFQLEDIPEDLTWKDVIDAMENGKFEDLSLHLDTEPRENIWKKACQIYYAQTGKLFEKDEDARRYISELISDQETYDEVVNDEYLVSDDEPKAEEKPAEEIAIEEPEALEEAHFDPADYWDEDPHWYKVKKGTKTADQDIIDKAKHQVRHQGYTTYGKASKANVPAGTYVSIYGACDPVKAKEAYKKHLEEGKLDVRNFHAAYDKVIEDAGYLGVFNKDGIMRGKYVYGEIKSCENYGVKSILSKFWAAQFKDHLEIYYGTFEESLELNEAKRYVKRYYIRPQNIFCSNKEEILKALVEVGDENCSVYSLKALADHDDVHLLKPSDIIYYYDEGILYDKNHVKVMDYDLFVKHEEERKKFGNVNAVSDATFEDEYDDRLTDADLKDKEIKVRKPTHEHLVKEDTKMTYKYTKDELKAALDNGETVELGSSSDAGSFSGSFSDGGVYSNTDYVIGKYKDKYYVDEYNYSDDGDCEEGDSEEFSDFDEFYDYVKENVPLGNVILEDFHNDAFNLTFESVNVYGETLNEGKDDKFICCICGEESTGYGNNPAPVKEEGKCCDACNRKFVIPARLNLNAEAMIDSVDED